MNVKLKLAMRSLSAKAMSRNLTFFDWVGSCRTARRAVRHDAKLAVGAVGGGWKGLEVAKIWLLKKNVIEVEK